MGFNAGHSALVWLLSTPPSTRVLAFDLLDHPYTSPSISYLHSLFPGRLEVVAGDSGLSVPSFVAMHPHFSCDVVFIDGGHETDQALRDLRNFRALAKPDSIVVLDDMDVRSVRAALEEMVQEGIVVEGNRSWHRVETMGLQLGLLEKGVRENSSTWNLWRTRPQLHLYRGMYAEVMTLSYVT